jgi:uncharacterized protein YcbX
VTEAATLSGIRLYPIKALDPLVVSEARVLPGGALAGDRRWAMVDAEGRFVNGKRHPGVHAIRARFAADASAVVLSTPADPAGKALEVSLDGDPAPAERWLSEQLGQPIRLTRDDAGGFPDDRTAAGPTVVSEASIAAVASWFPGLTADSVRRRFRANLEVAGVPAFWEDRLCGPAGTAVSFQVGEATFLGTNPCQRCAVPPRDPDTGEILPGFQKRFSDLRRATLPAWAEAARFDHFYRFTVNTRVSRDEGERVLRLGDLLRIAGPIPM